MKTTAVKTHEVLNQQELQRTGDHADEQIIFIKTIARVATSPASLRARRQKTIVLK